MCVSFYVCFSRARQESKHRSIGIQVMKVRFFKFVSTAESIMTKSPPVQRFSATVKHVVVLNDTWPPVERWLPNLKLLRDCRCFKIHTSHVAV